MKHFRIELAHLWDRTHFKNKRIVAALSEVVCNFPGLRCYQPCTDCHKNDLAVIGKLVIKNYDPGVKYANGEIYDTGKIRVEILIHCPDNRIGVAEKLAQKIAEQVDKVIAYKIFESDAPLF